MTLSVLGHLSSGDKRLNCPFKISPHIVRGFVYGIEIAKCYSVSVNADFFLFEIDRFVSLAVFQIVFIFVFNVIIMFALRKLGQNTNNDTNMIFLSDCRFSGSQHCGHVHCAYQYREHYHCMDPECNYQVSAMQVKSSVTFLVHPLFDDK